jgi:[acyl-carrier-protein] S-malonyltransferase
MKTALVFSGQGSQYVGMMKDINEKYPSAREIIAKADSLLGYSLSTICFDGPNEELKKTKYTQPAIFLHSALIIELLGSKLSFDGVAGHSIGEYAALFAAGSLKFEDALRLVSLRGELMFSAGVELPGTMFAVIGMDDDKVSEVCSGLTKKSTGNHVVAANFNSPGQIVVSGSAQYLRDNIGEFKAAGAKMVKELEVSGAFHSPLMEPAKNELEKAIEKIEFKDAKVPLFTNVYAKPMQKAEELKSALILQLTSPVLWSQTLNAMKSDGFNNFKEVGPGKVLQGLAKRTLTDIEIGGIDTVGEVENYL